MMMKPFKIGEKFIGDGCPAFVVAEMAWSHDGSPEKAEKIVEGAARAGADAICFHLTFLEDYMVPHYGSGPGRVSAGKETREIFQYLQSINLNRQDWEKLFALAKKRGLLICAMCNDLPSVELAAVLKPDAYVISSSCFVEEELVKAVGGRRRPVFLRIGGALLGEIERTVQLLKEAGSTDMVLIYGFQNYPTRLEDLDLRFISTLRQIFGLPVGFADHTDGASELALIIPLLALPFGASLIEKHLTHDRDLRGEDFESALDPADFAGFVSRLREVEKTFGSSIVRPLSEAELSYRLVSRKRTVAGMDIEAGEEITGEKLSFKRADEGIYPDESRFLLGRKAKVEIKKNEGITREKLV